jgi:uncharacterized protein YicC (UPF0701 family)
LKKSPIRSPRREIGKRLDFLIQELQREANTLGSQISSALELTNIAVGNEGGGGKQR